MRDLTEINNISSQALVTCLGWPLPRGGPIESCNRRLERVTLLARSFSLRRLERALNSTMAEQSQVGAMSRRVPAPLNFYLP